MSAPTPISVWPHLFSGAGREKTRGEQLRWSLTFRLYIGNCPCAQLPGPVHTARLGRVCFCVFSVCLCFVRPFVLPDLFVCPHYFMFPWAVESPHLVVGASVTNINEPPGALATSTVPPSLLGRCKQKQRGLKGLLCRWPSITE